MSRDLLANLNEYQMRAVMDDSPACLVNANVGSGKTTVLIAKVFYLYEQKKVPLENMVVLTFTNKAANEIKDRIRMTDASLTDEEMPYFGTFHSVALKMLKTILPIQDLGFTAEFSVIDPDEESDLARQIIMENTLNIKYIKKILNRIEKALQGQELYGVMKTHDDILKLIEILQVEKQKQNKLNFNDLIEKATMLLPYVSFRPQWIIIDEFQDSDERQLEFIKALHGSTTQLFVVGDPNQVIYTWRGSKLDLFSTFQQEYRATVISLPVNYRSSSNILDVAKCFMGNGEELTGVRESGNKIVVKNHYDAFNEAQYLAEQVQSIISSGDRYDDIAILYRMQSQSRLIEDAFQNAGIPFTVSLRKTVKDIPVLRWLIRVLRFCVNPQDTNSALLALSDSQYGERFSEMEARIILNNNDEKSSALYENMCNFSLMSDMFTSIDDIILYLDIDKLIIPTSVSFAKDKSYVMSFFSHINEYTVTNNLPLYDGIKEYIDSAMLYGLDFLKDDNAAPDNCVKLMTLHAAKGLEFKYVYIIGANQGVIPLRRYFFEEEDEEEKEERRLFFVGITRAKDNLELSYYTSPHLSNAMPSPSYYLSMLPPHLVDRQDEDTYDVLSLQDLRHAILHSRKTESTIISDSRINTEQPKPQKARHPKYGEGFIINETDDTVVVSFEGYGKKEFMKMFGEVEIIKQ
ncbi:MAG: ATP-dependent helicase [Christensenellales bacterium]